MKRVNQQQYKALTSRYNVKIVAADDNMVLVKLVGKKNKQEGEVQTIKIAVDTRKGYEFEKITTPPTQRGCTGRKKEDMKKYEVFLGGELYCTFKGKDYNSDEEAKEKAIQCARRMSKDPYNYIGSIWIEETTVKYIDWKE